MWAKFNVEYVQLFWARARPNSTALLSRKKFQLRFKIVRWLFMANIFASASPPVVRSGWTTFSASFEPIRLRLKSNVLQVRFLHSASANATTSPSSTIGIPFNTLSHGAYRYHNGLESKLWFRKLELLCTLRAMLNHRHPLCSLINPSYIDLLFVQPSIRRGELTR